jgi:hypothetical protein
MYFNMVMSCSGRPWHRISTGVVNFFYSIFSYFSFLSLASIFCHGSYPRKTYIRPSISSRRPCSTPRCVLIEAYRAVPVRFLLSLYGMCVPSRDWNFLARPKSIINTVCAYLSFPIRKLSGLISRCMKPCEWIYSMRSKICRPIIMMVLHGNSLPYCLKRDSSELPRGFITIIFY